MLDTNEQVIQEVNELKKCCETCKWLRMHNRSCPNCMNTDAPIIDFDGWYGDPAEFWCNHWQQKEEQK